MTKWLRISMAKPHEMKHFVQMAKPHEMKHFVQAYKNSTDKKTAR